MKKLLSLLLAFVFLNVESQAYYPSYGGLGLNPVGTYGGTMVPDTSAAGGGGAAGNVSTAISIGLYSLGVPQVGLATGSFAVFIEGGAYVGNIIGYVDPRTETISCILSGFSTFQIALEVGTDSNGNPIFKGFNIACDGNMVATFSSGTQSTGVGNTVNMDGTADIVAFLSVDNNGAPIPTADQAFIVSGTQQSGSVQPTTITLTSATNGS